MTRYHPDLLNQFNRLIEVTPQTTYTRGSRWNNIVNGVNLDNVNCQASQGAICRDADTGGRDKSSPAQIRNNQSDLSGGMGLDDVDNAWNRLWGEVLDQPVSANWNDAMDLVRQGRYVIVDVDYAAVPYEYQVQKGGTFLHGLGMCDVRSDGTVLKYDSLDTAIRRVPQQALRFGAQRLALDQRGTVERLFVAYSNVMPLVGAEPGVTYLFGGKPIGRGRFVARKVIDIPLVPVHSSPNQKATVTHRMKPGDDFNCRQTSNRKGMAGGTLFGNSTWRGTADGRCWVNDSLLWFSGHSTGKEDVR